MRKQIKLLIYILISIIVCLSVVSCDFEPRDNSVTESSVSEEHESYVFDESEESDGDFESISGIIIDKSDGYVRLISEKVIYKFYADDSRIKSGSTKFILGYEAEVRYTGELDKTSENQTVFVSKIIVDTEYNSYEERAKQILDTMSTDEKIGQLFLVRCYPDKAVEDIKNLYIGGLVLFASDFNKSPDEVKADIKKYKSAARFGLVVSADEEGGTVVRVSRYPQFRKTPFLSPQKLYKDGGFKLIKSDTAEKAELLISLGINVNLAPVADVPSSKNSFIYQRSFGTDAALTSKYIAEVVGVNREKGIGSVLKHFPGYGDNSDTHIGFSFDNKSLSVFRERDFLPFKAGIAAGVEAVMVSHNTVTSMDDKNPASLSKAVHGILRDELRFDGVIITDDLSMDAVKDYIKPEEVGVRAVLAGNDVICTSDYELLYDSIKEAVENGDISEERINESVIRVLVWKLKLKIID